MSSRLLQIPQKLINIVVDDEVLYLYSDKSQKGVLYKGRISQKGVKDIAMKRKIYQQLLDWKEKRNGEVALLVEGA